MMSVIEPGVGYHVYDARGVFQLIQLIESQKTCAGEIGFLAENAVKFDGVANRFVNLQAELAGTEYEGANFLRALRCGMKRGGFFGDKESVSH
jgi:hypothetical protein